jgi:hypothetical protein
MPADSQLVAYPTVITTQIVYQKKNTTQIVRGF